MFQPLFQFNRAVVVGAVMIFAGIAISSIGIAHAARFNPLAGVIYKCSTGIACVEGDSSGKAWGMFGTSTGGNGVEGQSSATARAGVAGINLGTAGYGVYGESADTSGKYAALFGQGDASTTNLLYAYNRASSAKCTIDPVANLTCTGAILGRSQYNNGIEGTSVYGNGVWGEGENNFATGVTAIADTPKVDALYATGNTSAGGGDCVIDYYGNLSCTGTITGGVNPQTRQRTSNGTHVLAYAAESASATIEDVGTARVVDGAAHVPMDAAFALTIDRTKPYYVFLTPLGDTRGLYVSAKTPSGYDVREVQRGHSNLGFDYRIVAHAFGAKNDRLPPAPKMRTSRLPKPPSTTP